MQVNVHEAKTQLSRLLELVESGESVVIARNGTPVARLVRATRQTGFPFGVASTEPLAASGDAWWAPMDDEEADSWAAPLR
jgi:prevent-host-death family protein